MREIAPRFTLMPFDEVEVGTDRTYVVKGIIPRSGLVVVWGPPKCGKSFWVYDLVMHVALGRPYRGRRVRQRPVVYLALEGSRGFKARIKAFQRRFIAEGAGPTPFYLVADALNLVQDHTDLIGCIRLQAGKPARPLSLSTRSTGRSRVLNPTTGTWPPTSRQQMRSATLSIAWLSSFTIAVFAGTRPRGHTSQTGAADTQLATQRDTSIVSWSRWNT